MSKYVYLSLAIIAVILMAGGFVFSGNGTNDEVSNSANILESTSTREMTAIISTNFGEIKLELFEDKAPNTVENFVRLAQGGFYNGTKFHRVILGFMIQGGDPFTKDDSQKELWGFGGPGYTFADEIYEGNSNSFGTISMANTGPNTNGSQFFINTVDNNPLNPRHTVFGRVIDGIEVVRGIENLPTDDDDRPLQPAIINSIRVE